MIFKKNFKDHVTINFNTFSFNAKDPEELKNITAKLLEELPEVKNNYRDVASSNNDRYTDNELDEFYVKWKDDLMAASTVVMKILARCSKKYNGKIEVVNIRESRIELH